MKKRCKGIEIREGYPSRRITYVLMLINRLVESVIWLAQSVGAVEYTDCTSAEG